MTDDGRLTSKMQLPIRRREISPYFHLPLATFHLPLFYSYLSAAIGSVREALRAGIYPATAATANINTVAADNASGSAAVSPKSRLEINFDAPNTAGRPIAAPTTTISNVSRKTSQTKSRGGAPSA